MSAPAWRVFRQRPGKGGWMALRATLLGKPWHVETPYGFPGPSFATHDEAIAAAQHLARDADAELRMEVGV